MRSLPSRYGLSPAPNSEQLATITCCPRCRAKLEPGGDLWRCARADCVYARTGFPVVSGQPVLVDFDRSIFRRANYEHGSGSVRRRPDESGRFLRTRVRRAIEGPNPVANRMCHTVLRLARERSSLPLVLVVAAEPSAAAWTHYMSIRECAWSVPTRMYRPTLDWWPTDTHCRFVTGCSTRY